MTRQVVVTRPEREAPKWVAALSSHGWKPVALPLIAFGPPTRVDVLHAARADMPTFDAVMFVSAQAVQAFVADNFEEKVHPALFDIHQSAIKIELAGSPRFWAPGPGTAQVLSQAGVRPERIDQPAPDATQFDSEALWAQVKHQVRPGFRLLIVRGEVDGVSPAPSDGQGSGREWLADRCREAGAFVQMCAAYRRQWPVWTSAMQQAAHQAAVSGAVWLFSSSEGLGNLARLLPGQVWSGALALTTHGRIAQAAARLGFGEVKVCRPAVSDVLQTLNSWLVEADGHAAAVWQPPKMGGSS